MLYEVLFCQRIFAAQFSMDAAKFCGNRFLVCHDPFAGVTNAFFVIARPLKKAVAISGLQTIEIAALGYASLAMTIAANFLSPFLADYALPKNLPHLSVCALNPPGNVTAAP